MTMIAARGVPSGRAQYAAKSPSPSSGVIVSISVILALLGYGARGRAAIVWWPGRSEEHTSELQSLMRISYAVFCLKKKNTNTQAEQRQTKCGTKMTYRIHN